ncbi:MAG: SulP family inorganic anion transporter [Sphingobacteriaceae bacterium]
MNKSNLSSDIKAGVVVFLVALPLCLGISMACKVPLFSGLLAGIIGGIIVTIFSGSVLSVSGPAAGLTAIVIASVASLGSFESFLAAVLVAGILQLIFGFLKAGSIGNYIPYSVIKGMLAGIGIILIMKQIPHLVGYDFDPEGDLEFNQTDGHNTFSDLFYMFNYITPGAVIIGLLSIVILVLTEKEFYKKNKVLSLIPGPLIVVVVGVVLGTVFNGSSQGNLAISAEHMVSLPVIKSFGDFKDALIAPDFSKISTGNFWVIAFTLAFVAGLETLLSIEATDKLDPHKRNSNSNKELIAQGIGNTLCGLVGALPVTAVIVRSSANINAGGKTKLSAIIHAVLLFVSVLAIPSILMLIPNAALAGILIMTGYKLAKPSLFKEQYKKGFEHIMPFVVTIVVMLVTDLLKGVAAGLILAVIFIIRSNIKSTFDIAKAEMDGRLHHVVKLPQHVTFFNKGFLIKYFAEIKEGSVVIIDGSVNKICDKDSLEVISDFYHAAKERDIKVQLTKFEIENEYGK